MHYRPPGRKGAGRGTIVVDHLSVVHIYWYKIIQLHIKINSKKFIKKEWFHIRNKVFTISHLGKLSYTVAFRNETQRVSVSSLRPQKKQSNGRIAKVSRNTWKFLLAQTLYMHIYTVHLLATPLDLQDLNHIKIWSSECSAGSSGKGSRRIQSVTMKTLSFYKI